MPTAPNQNSTWHTYRRRRRLFFGILLTYVPGVFILGYPLMRLIGSEVPLYIIAGGWMLAFFVSGIYLSSFPCPNCHRSFFRTWYSHNPFAMRCVHCGFQKWQDVIAESKIEEADPDGQRT